MKQTFYTLQSKSKERHNDTWTRYGYGDTREKSLAELKDKKAKYPLFHWRIAKEVRSITYIY